MCVCSCVSMYEYVCLCVSMVSMYEYVWDCVCVS